MINQHLQTATLPGGVATAIAFTKLGIYGFQRSQIKKAYDGVRTT
ncbi:MAG: hypothetical protein V7K55_16140 [Nostoc sp.]